MADAVSPPSLRSRDRARAPRKGRRVTRVVRRIELWSVTKIALVFIGTFFQMVLVVANTTR